MTMKLFGLAAALLLAAAPLHAQPARTCAPRPGTDTTKAVRDSTRAAYRAVERRLEEEVRAAARAAGVDPIEGLLIFRSDSLNRTRILPAEINFPVDVLREIEPRLQAEIAKVVLVPGCPFIVWLEPNSVPFDSASLARGARERAPVITNRGEIRGYLEAWARGDRQPARHQVVVAGIVTRSGRGIIPEIAQSSGDPELDQFALQLFRIFKFSPATVNGRPVHAWARIPLTTISGW
jgi:TonB family protein